MSQDEISRPSLAGTLTERVLDLIHAGGLRAGDRLPATRELARRFAVTTPTLREALRRLEATGAVELRHGSGIYVGPSLERIVLPNPNVRGLRRGQLEHLLEARLLIEPPAAALAARQAGEAERAALRAELEIAAAYLEGNDARLHEANMGFHRATVRATGNLVLGEVVDSLLTVHAPEQRAILQIFDDRVRDHEEHRAVLAAIEDGDPAAAEEHMRAHLVDVLAVVRQRLQPPATGPAAS
jgi:GntR family transcriptional regulator, transcriptional repressor for pyruvate dehydrogenase complex